MVLINVIRQLTIDITYLSIGCFAGQIWGLRYVPTNGEAAPGSRRGWEIVLPPKFPVRSMDAGRSLSLSKHGIASGAPWMASPLVSDSSPTPFIP
jgi:hypothetical protein